jgi:hypothetical protein
MAGPGVIVTTTTRIGPTAPLKAPSGKFFAAGLTERGDTSAAIEVRNMTDVEALTGNRVTYGALYDALQLFFNEGGEGAYLSRVVGPSATKGTLTLVDRAGSPVNTLRVDAQNAGSWSSTLQVQVLDGSLSNTFRIIVTLSGVIVEDWNNLVSPAAAALIASDSKYVRITDLASATVAPNNNPAVLAATALSAGSDDRASVTTSHYTAALTRFTKELGDGAVAIPGQNGSAIWTAINTHCVANNRVGLLADARAATVQQLVTNASGVNSEYCGLFAPWLKVSDGAGGSRVVSPEGYVAAARARAHLTEGPWRAPAGGLSVASTILDVDVRYSPDDGATLNGGRVSAIRFIANSIRLYGWRSTSADAVSFYMLKDRDFLNYLVTQSEALLEPFVFSTIDRKGQLLSSVNGALSGMCLALAQKNAFFPLLDGVGNQIDPGYSVDTGATVNTPATAASHQINAKLSVRVSPTGEQITLNIVKADLSASLG